MFIDYFAHICLKFGHVTFILPLVLVGMIFGKRDVWAKATCFLLWVMIFNTLLKHLFKVPLFPHLGPGYAFPSGHMHAALAFYGYFLYKTDNKFLKFGIIILLCCFGFSLIHCHFHDLIDIMGAVGFAIAEFVTYHLISKNHGDRVVGAISIISAITIMVALSIIYKVEYHVWLAFYGLVGMEAALASVPEKTIDSASKKFFALSISLAAIAVVYYFFKLLAFGKYYFSEIKFALIPLIIVGAMQFVARPEIGKDNNK